MTAPLESAIGQKLCLMDDEPRAGIKLSPPLATDDLIRAAQRGDTLAMNDLLDLLIPYVARICGPIALDVAADAAQEALIAIFRNLKRLREPAALRGWVRVIATREAVRMAKRRSALPIGDLAEIPAPGNQPVMSSWRRTSGPSSRD